MPTPVTATPRARALSWRRSSSSTMVSSAVPAPRSCVGTWTCSSTRPSALTRPAATVVPPTSTPIVMPLTGRALLQVPEVDEPDPFSLDEGAGLGIGEPGHLGLALAAVAAVGEIVVVVAGVGHELGDPARQLPQVGEH